MCLFKDRGSHPDNRPLIAEEDIVCYKQLYTVYGSSYTTPYTDTIVPNSCLNQQIPFKAKIVKKLKFFWNHILGMSYVVYDGFIHTYTYPKIQYGYISFKCIIPKGTKYFIGENSDLASRKIIFLEKINKH